LEVRKTQCYGELSISIAGSTTHACRVARYRGRRQCGWGQACTKRLCHHKLSTVSIRWNKLSPYESPWRIRSNPLAAPAQGAAHPRWNGPSPPKILMRDAHGASTSPKGGGVAQLAVRSPPLLGGVAARRYNNLTYQLGPGTRGLERADKHCIIIEETTHK